MDVYGDEIYCRSIKSENTPSGATSAESVLTMCFFFFQAEDGIRDLTVTGVQTCALPIFCSRLLGRERITRWTASDGIIFSVRLVQIKLAGFKSFVDPTSIHVPGQLVGVVGPNGCGKSNVIDAVRWVLGESRAAALRGDSMQDGIFNGSGEPAPPARAAVELSF